MGLEFPSLCAHLFFVYSYTHFSFLFLTWKRRGIVSDISNKVEKCLQSIPRKNDPFCLVVSLILVPCIYMNFLPSLVLLDFHEMCTQYLPVHEICTQYALWPTTAQSPENTASHISEGWRSISSLLPCRLTSVSSTSFQSTLVLGFDIM